MYTVMHMEVLLMRYLSYCCSYVIFHNTIIILQPGMMISRFVFSIRHSSHEESRLETAADPGQNPQLDEDGDLVLSRAHPQCMPESNVILHIGIIVL